jgi:predicted nucleotidyltransferase
MIPLVEHHRKQIADLCRRSGVVRLDVCGSAATGAFSEDSDLDFVAIFSDPTPCTYADHYLTPCSHPKPPDP